MEDDLTQFISNRNLSEIWNGVAAERARADKAIEFIVKEQGFDRLIELVLSDDFESLLQNFSKFDHQFDQSPTMWLLQLRFPFSRRSIHSFQSDEHARASEYLDAIKEQIAKGLGSLIHKAIAQNVMPDFGIVLYFTRDISYSFLVSYRLVSNKLVLEITTCIPEPKALFDIVDVSDLKSARERSIAKSFLQSGHKAIVHNGILTHVDRRKDQGVFGPSIDTLVLAKCLRGLPGVRDATSILEIGVGSGHVLNSAIASMEQLGQAEGIDINASAIFCTHRNYLRVSENQSNTSKRDVSLTIGRFTPERYSHKFEIVVCNPPYISVPSGISIDNSALYKEAVSGTELIKSVLDSLPQILADHGMLLLMVSSATTSFPEIVPPTLIARELKMAGLSVPFDLEVAYEYPEWIDYLLDHNAITKRDEAYYHQLRPFVVSMKESNDADA